MIDNIEKAFVACTSHITQATAKALTACVDGTMDLPILVYAKGDVGWLIYTHPTMTLDMGGIPTELRNLIDAAKVSDCVWLMLDCDGNTLDGFPTFDW